MRDEAAYRELLARLFALADVVKLSAADISWLAPGQTVEAERRDLKQKQADMLRTSLESRGGGNPDLAQGGGLRGDLTAMISFARERLSRP